MLFSKKITDMPLGFFILLGVLILSFLREPLFFLEPRLWAEEGTVHIQSVFENGIWGSLFQPHLGYYSIFNNYVVALGLGLSSLEKVAYFTTLFSFLISTVTILTPLLLKSKYWDTDSKKSLIIFFSLLTGTAEIWVNTVNAQFYFGLFTCFLLLSDTTKISNWRCFFVLVMLIQAVLTGITSVVLLPFFIWKYLQQKTTTKFEKIVLVILCFGLSVQLLALFYLGSISGIGRFSLSNLPNLPYGIFKNLTSFVPVGDIGIRVIFLVAVIALAVKLFFKLVLINPAAIALYISAIFAFLALDMHGGGRYGFMPAVLIFIFLVNLYSAENKKAKHLKNAIIASLIIISLTKFFKTTSFYDPSWVKYSLENAYSNANGDLEVKIFPQSKNMNWALVLPNGKYEKFR